jgi:hypothetical protein
MKMHYKIDYNLEDTPLGSRGHPITNLEDTPLQKSTPISSKSSITITTGTTNAFCTIRIDGRGD